MKNIYPKVLIALLAMNFASLGSAQAWQMISFTHLDAVTDNQIIYTFLKNSYFSKSLLERKTVPFRYALGKCNLLATSEDDGVKFEMQLTGTEPVALSLNGSVLDAGNELSFVKFFREQTSQLGCF